jgi:hypothetical protein
MKDEEPSECPDAPYINKEPSIDSFVVPVAGLPGLKAIADIQLEAMHALLAITKEATNAINNIIEIVQLPTN